MVRVRSRWRRVLRALALGLAALVGLVALALAVVLATPFGRDFLRVRVNAVLAEQFAGTLVIDRLGGAGPAGVSGVDVTVLDARNQRVLSARGCSVDANVPGLGWAFATKSGRDIVIDLAARCAHVEARLIDDGTGSPTIASAFDPRVETPEPEGGESPRIVIRSLELDHAWVHGSLSGTPLDVELLQLFATLESARALDLKVERSRVIGRGLPAVRETRGWLSAAVHQEPEAEVRVGAELRGTTLGSDYSLSAALDGERLSGAVVVPALSPATLREFAPELDVGERAMLVASAGGSFDELWFDAELSGSNGRLASHGVLTTGEPVTLDASVSLRDVELGRFVKGAPAGQVALHGSVWLEMGDDMHGLYRVDAAGSTLLGERLTRFSLHGDLKRAEGDDLMLSGELALGAQGIGSTLSYTLRSGDTTRLRAKLDADLADPALIARPASLFVDGAVDARVDYEIEPNRIEATANAHLTRVRVPGSLDAADIEIEASARGLVSEPALRADLAVRRLEAAGRAFQAVRLRASGSPARFQLQGSAEDERSRPFDLAARLSLKDGVHVDGASVVRGEGGDALRVGVERARFSESEIEVKGLMIAGAGTARADLRYKNGIESLRFESNELDGVRLAREAAIDLPLQKLTISLSGEYSRASGEGFARGEAKALVKRTPAVNQPDQQPRPLPLALTVDLAARDGTLSGKAEIDAAGTRVQLDADEVRASSLAAVARAPLATPGSVRLSGVIDLANLSDIGVLSAAGVERAAGKLNLEVFVPEIRKAGRNSVVVHVASRGLELVGQRAPASRVPDTATAERVEPWVVRGIDVDMTLAAAFAEHHAGVSGRLFDEHGTLLEARVESELPPGSVVRPEWISSFLDARVRAELTLPKRRLSQLPPAIRPATIDGSISARVTAEGTPRRPDVVARVQASKLRMQSDRSDQLDPIDANVEVAYAREGGRMEAVAAVDRRPALKLSSRWSGDLAAVPAAVESAAPSPVQGAAQLDLERFPLSLVPALASRRVQGVLDGKVEVEGFGRAPVVTADVRATRFAVDRIAPADGTLRAKLEGAKVEAGVELHAGASRAKISWDGGVDWGAKVVPASIKSRALHAELRRFELGTVFPLVEGDVSELSGKVDADVHVIEREPGPDVRGQLALRDGVLQIPAIGQRFHDIEAKATLVNGEVSVPNLRARGITGALSASARARLRNLELTEATASVKIKEDEKIPVTVEGVSMGDAWGDLAFRFARTDGSTRLEANVERLHVHMPEMAPSSVQGFEPAAHVKVGVFRRDGAFSAIPMQPIQAADEGGQGKQTGGETLLRVKIGNEVWVHQGEKFDVRFRGAFDARLGEEPRLEGKIDLAGGTLDVSGKRFEIETGTITFNGPIEQAIVTATARWDSPAGYSVYADFSGTVSDGKIELRSEPPLARDEVLSLLLFGTPDGSVGSGSGDQATTAASVAGDTAAAGLNQLLTRFTELDVSARIDTSTGTARPELVLQVTPRLTARVTRALGEPTPGQSPDRTFFTLELRLRRRWSLAAIVGDHGGTALEVVWRLRY